MEIKRIGTSQHGKIFTAVVISSSSGSRAVTISPEGYNHTDAGSLGMQQQAVVASALVSNFLGFKDCSLPQPGTRVLCATAATTCYIIGILPSSSLAVDALPSRAMLGAKNALADGANRVGHRDRTTVIHDGRMPTDVVDGEYVVANELGVLLGLYQEMASLKASELAQIQCFLFDDLVRIISHNYQHFTSMGEYNIYNDGKRLMSEFGATHIPAEAYGRPAVEGDGSEPVFKDISNHSVDDKSDFYDFSVDERLKAVERFKLFLGSVGDFLHLFVVRPDPKEIRIQGKDATSPDTGLSDIHLGIDGGIHVRSVKEIFLEKTNWIRVPARIAAPDDPEGDDANSLDYEKKKPFKFNEDYKFKENPMFQALQLRDYVAYVNEKLNYQNFKKHEKDFTVNDDISQEKALNEIKELDKESSLNQESYKLNTAGVYLMPNGGITIRDAWNSAIVMEGGNIYLQPAKDLVSQPLRSNIVKAGGNINMTCRGHIDLSSTLEGIRVKSAKSQYYYSDKSGIILEANGVADTRGQPTPSPDDPAQAIDYIGGIVIKSKLGIYNYAAKDIVNYAKKKLILQSLNTMDVISDENMTIYSKKSMFRFADDRVLDYGKKSAIYVTEGFAEFSGAKATLLGQQDQPLGVMYDEDSMFVDVLKGVGVVSKIVDSISGAKDAKKESVINATTFNKPEYFDDLRFAFLDSTDYHITGETDSLPSTMAQQDAELTKLYSLEAWAEPEVNGTKPYPGKDLFENFYLFADKPVNLKENKIGKSYSNKADSEETPNELQLKSLEEYKVQPKDTALT